MIPPDSPAIDRTASMTGLSPEQFAKSRIVHSTLTKVLGPWFAARGWSRQKGGSCAFQRPRPEPLPGAWGCAIQITRLANTSFGSRFAINLHGPARGIDLQARVLRRLDAADCHVRLGIETLHKSRVRAMWEAIGLNEPFQGWMIDGTTVEAGQWQAGRERWLYYFSPDDVQAWADFLLPQLDHLIEGRVREAEAALAAL